MFRTLSAALILALAALPAHAGHKDKAMDHGAGHAHDATPAAANAAPDPKIAAAVAAGGDLIAVDVLGVVCDFCATALTKTFAKRGEIAASSVDLGAKTLTIVTKPGKSVDDDLIRKLVERAGYNTASIRRGADALAPAKDAGASGDDGHGTH